MSISTRSICLPVIGVLAVGLAIAQDGVSSAGAARAKYLSGMGMIPASREVSVEDLVNYHRHEIGRPKAGEAVALDVRWTVSAGNEPVLQVGLATGLANDRQQLRPLNLALVIDKSGSMAEADKLTRVKAALVTMISQLRPTDTLSIVVFDNEASVLFPGQRLADRSKALDIVRSLEPGSATNLNAGLMLGYEQAQKTFQKNATNRVILLTDGIANRGTTDPKEISKGSLVFNDKGIDLSTIGVGLDLDKDLLMDLARSGRGLYHFVADAEDVDKVFVKELQSLISPVANEPTVEIVYEGLNLDKVYGYEPKLGEDSVKVKLANLNSGATEVVLLRFNKMPGRNSGVAKVKLSYYDLDRKRTVEKTESAFLNLTASNRGQAVRDTSVEKNYAIAQLAQGIRDMAAACEGQRYAEAEGILTKVIDKTSRSYPNKEDADIKRTLAIAQKYQQVLRDEIRARGRGTDSDSSIVASSGNIIANGDFSQGNSGFMSGLTYISPAPNCLWPMGYTVAPKFNDPLLHRLIANSDYAAPKRAKGTEQVFFANAGGTESLVLWSSVVQCKPNTKYRISFQSISLTPGPEWVPLHEITVNGHRSSPQAAGQGAYAEISMVWESGRATTATLTILRLPIPHGGGLIGISNIEMIPTR